MLPVLSMYAVCIKSRIQPGDIVVIIIPSMFSTVWHL